jgi:hypothetical protein
MNEFDFYENAVVRMLDRHYFPPPWSVEEASFCFVVRDRNSQAFAHVYCDEDPTAKLLTREEAQDIARNIARLQPPAF